MTTVYFKYSRKQKREINFFNFLKSQFEILECKNYNYSLDSKLISNLLDINKIKFNIEKDNLLSESKKTLMIKELNNIPRYIKVANSMNFVSVDYAIVYKGKIFFIEFHEEQHRRLSVNRKSPIFCSDGNRYELSRFTQRFLKDIWRYENLPNYKIIWFDWFEKNKNLAIDEILNSEKKEFFIQGKFNFTQFLI